MAGFVPPPYPYDRLDLARRLGEQHFGSIIDLSVGTPCDPPIDAVLAALSTSNTERGYPPSIGTPALREAISQWLSRRFSIAVPVANIAACIGTKEFVATTPQYLRLRSPERDTVLYPAIAYPTYEMGAILAGCRPVAVPLTPAGGLDLSAIGADDAQRALCLWANSPSNPTGALDDLMRVAAWGRAHEVLVLSDECYTEFTWDGPPRTILESGLDGVVAVHSLSKRSNLAGVRVGFYVGDGDVVDYLREVRKHAGFMVPGPAQAAGVAALNDDAHVVRQRGRYHHRLVELADALEQRLERPVPLPAGGFYLWFEVGDGWNFAEFMAVSTGALVSPGEFYGPQSTSFARIALVQPDDQIELVVRRLRTSR